MFLPVFYKLSHHLYALAMASGFTCLVFWSKQVGGVPLFSFLALMSSMTVGLFGYYLLLNKLKITLSISFVLFWAVTYRLLALLGLPIMEDDQYRFMLDGCVFLEYGSPYGMAPLSLFASNSLSPACAELLNWVNNPDIATIYGPVLQILFLGASFISTANVTILQAIMALFDIGIVLLLLRYASPNKVLLYAWCPLVLKEFAFTAHPDVVGVFLLLAAYYCARIEKPNWSAILLASACAAKVFAIILAPFLLLLIPRKSALLFLAALAAWYLPFIWLGSGADVLGGFARSWLFNPTLFSGFLSAFSDQNARWLSLVLFSLVWCAYFLNWWTDRNLDALPRGDFLFVAFLLLSPIFNAWYGVWILAFAVVKPSAWAWSFSLALLLTYVTGINWMESGLRAYQMAGWAQAGEITIIAAGGVLSYLIYKRGKQH